MRILTIVHGFPPLAQGGSEIYAWQVCHAWAKLFPKDELFVVTREEAAERAELSLREDQTQGFPIFWINNQYRTSSCYQDSYCNPLITCALDHLVEDIQPHAVHIHHLTHLSVGIVPILAANKIPIMMTLHDFWYICPRGQLLDNDLNRCPGPYADQCCTCVGVTKNPKNMLSKMNELRLPTLMKSHANKFNEVWNPKSLIQDRIFHMRRALEHAHALLAPSKTLVDVYARFGAPISKLIYWPYGHTSPETPNLQERNSILTIGFFGTLMASKAPHLAIEALSMLPKDSAELHLYGDVASYHGDDNYRHKLNLDAPNVVHHGKVSREQALKAMAAMDVVVVPSVWMENAPLVISEAFLTRTPVVASNMGGMAEMVQHKVNGLLFEPNDSEDLANKLRLLQQDKTLLDKLQKGIPSVRTIENDAQALHKLFSQALQKATYSKRTTTTVVVPMCGHADLAIQAGKSVASQLTSESFLIFVANGSSNEDILKIKQAFPHATITKTNRALGFSEAINKGLSLAKDFDTDCVLLLNSDATLSADALSSLMQRVAKGQTDIISPLLIGDQTVEAAGIDWNPLTGRFRLKHHNKPTSMIKPEFFEVDAVCATAMLVRKEVLACIGLFDERFFCGLEDIDFCLQSKDMGFRIHCDTSVKAFHRGGATLNKDAPERSYWKPRNHLRLIEKHGHAGPFIQFAQKAYAALGIVAHTLLKQPGNKRQHVLAMIRGFFDGPMHNDPATNKKYHL